MRRLAILLCFLPAFAADYERDIQPLLKRRCQPCHGAALQKSHLRVDRLPDLLRGGESGIAAVVPGDANASLLIRYVSGKNPKLRMPPAGPLLAEAEVALLRAWIDDGAKGPAGAPDPVAADPRRAHWAFQPLPPQAPAIPAVKARAWVRNPIDAFVLARLEDKGWSPAPSASRPALFRRLHLDITGLPPSVEEQDRFQGDWDRLVDTLLARPAYGERWARHWLDTVRYADTNGYERDAVKPSGWKYRDYVIRSLNSDKPFDRFAIEQIAGDELPEISADTLLATGYHRLGPWDDEPADPAEDRFDQLDDLLNTTSQAFLGLTLACARCHNHKFEPLTTRDYYGMIAVFAGLDRPRNGRTELDRPIGTRAEIDRFNAREERIAALRATARAAWLAGSSSALSPAVLAAFRAEPAKRDEEQKKLVRENQKALDAELTTLPVEAEVARLKKETPDLPRGYFLEERKPDPPPTHILIRGKAASPGPEIGPSVPAVATASQPAFSPTERTSGRRLGLAQWIASRDNPLTARVIVNRIWQAHFGEGLVRTANDFGVMGDKPSHPELLDWLATWFMDNGWSLKKLHRLILTSSTYQMSRHGNPAYAAADPENRLLWRRPYQRLEAEALLDSALTVSGKLVPKLYGPFVYPEVPREALEGSSDPDKIWQPFAEAEASRRAIYYIVKRSLMVPLLEVLDLCDTARPSAKRLNTSVATQAMQLFNGAFVNRQAHHFADRLRREAGAKPEEQVRLAYRLALARPPSQEETRRLTQFLATSSLEEMCRVILNLNEFAYPD